MCVYSYLRFCRKIVRIHTYLLTNFKNVYGSLTICYPIFGSIDTSQVREEKLKNVKSHSDTDTNTLIGELNSK